MAKKGAIDMTTGYFEAIPLDDMTASQTQLSMEERI